MAELKRIQFGRFCSAPDLRPDFGPPLEILAASLPGPAPGVGGRLPLCNQSRCYPSRRNQLRKTSGEIGVESTKVRMLANSAWPWPPVGEAEFRLFSGTPLVRYLGRAARAVSDQNFLSSLNQWNRTRGQAFLTSAGAVFSLAEVAGWSWGLFWGGSISGEALRGDGRSLL